jgi:hypothetical protein
MYNESGEIKMSHGPGMPKKNLQNAQAIETVDKGVKSGLI